MKKKKKILSFIYFAEVLGIMCVLCFFWGKSVGAREEREFWAFEIAGRENSYQGASDSQTVQTVDKFEENENNQNENMMEDAANISEEKNDSSELPNVNKDDIILVNKNHALPEDYSVTLKTLPDGVNKAAEEAYQPMCDMLKAGRKEGLNFEICSSYRDVKRQRELFDEDMKKLIRAGYSYSEAYEEVERQTMPPGHSEHSTGLAFDIVALNYQMLDAGQERTAENKWLQEHCAEYGFILRYPKGKEEITDIDYESWHFRYVGVEVATYIMEKGITLEEFLED